MAVLGCWGLFFLLSIIFPAPSWHLHLFETNCRIICFSNSQEANSWFQGVGVLGTWCQGSGTAHRDLCYVRKYFIRLVFHEDTLAS